ncbi:MAG: alanine racemase [Actinobacteria bacterium]|nr:alanine racemase [Actinomycetota bacterium]
MKKYNSKLFKNNVLRKSWVEVDLDAISHNVSMIRAYLGKTIYLAVVKADAYGLGVLPIAKTILQNGADKLGLVTLEECIELRRAGITAPLLNMGPVWQEQADIVLKYDIEQLVYQLPVIEAISKAATKAGKTAKIHFKVDTGMSRYGVHFSQAGTAIAKAAYLPNIAILGVMTHFPMSDELDKSFALLQIERFKALRRRVEDMDIHIPLWHTANSGAVLDLPQAHFNMVRVGLMNFGYFPSKQVKRPFQLEPAMSVKSKIVEIRKIHRGDTVGYGRRFMAEKDEQIGVLPLGYADGYDRKIRSGGQVLIHGKRVPIVSGLCMDAFFVRLTDFPDVRIGDTATLMGIDDEEEISPHDIAGIIGSVSYEVISRFGKRLPRVYLQKGRIVEIHNYQLRN